MKEVELSTQALAAATFDALRVLIKGMPESYLVLSRAKEGRTLLKLLAPYLGMNGSTDVEIKMPEDPTRTEVEEYFVVQRKMLDADFAKLHAEEDRLRATQRETRALIKAALVFKKAAEKIVDSGVLAYWGNLK